jgi:hypothetical protein
MAARPITAAGFIAVENRWRARANAIRCGAA